MSQVAPNKCEKVAKRQFASGDWSRVVNLGSKLRTSPGLMYVRVGFIDKRR